MFAGVSAGYRFGGRLRVEAQWFHRESEYDQTSPVASATRDTFYKLGGEIQRAEVRVSSISSHNEAEIRRNLAGTTTTGRRSCTTG